MVHGHDFRILPQVGAGVAKLGILGERTTAVAIRADTAGAISATVLVRAIEEQAHAVLLRGHASPSVLDPFVGEFLRNVGLAVGEVIMGLDPVHGLVFGHFGMGGEVVGGKALVLDAVTHLMAIAGIGDATATRGAAVKQVGVIGFADVGILKHLAVLVLGTILQNGVPVMGLLAAEYLVGELDVLGRIVAETISAIGNGLHEQIMHALSNGIVLGVEVPQAGQFVLGAVLTVVVIGNLLIGVEVGLVLPLAFNHIEIGGEVVGYGIDDDAQTILVRHLAHFLEFSLRTDHVVADGHVSRLIHVVPVEVPVTGAELTVVLDLDNRLGLDGGITGLGDIRNILHDGLERPFEGVQGCTVLHVLRQTVLLTGRFEGGIANSIGVAVTGGGTGFLRSGSAQGKTREQRGCRGKERHGLLAQTSKCC